MLRRILLNIHKILGLLLSVLFLMWFLSGFVMIYHDFPNAARHQIEKQQVISGELPAVEDVISQLPDTARIQSLTLNMHFDRPVFHFRGRAVPPNLYADTFQPLEKFTEANIGRTAAQWCSAPVLRIDTMRKLDQWIPFGRLKEEFPIYKYTFDNQEKHELYISSKDGRVLQFTGKDQRFWAWLGAIPHYVYFTFLRQNQPVWINFVKWTSGIGCIMCLVGIILGLQTFWRSRRKGFATPYKKRWHRWHYISGLLFGVFAITFAFSGLMTLTSLPDWMMKKPKTQQETTQVSPDGARGGGSTRGGRGGGFGGRFGGAGATLALTDYTLDYRKVVEATEDIKSIEWVSYQRHPYYRVATSSKSVNIDASDSLEIRPFIMTEEMIRRSLRQTYGDSIKYVLTLMTEYDDDYYARKKNLAPLPVYRVIVDDEMHTHHYYHPETLMQQRVDDISRYRRNLYGRLHRLNFKFLTDRPVLWNIVMFTLMIGGSFLSLTGVVLSVKWIIRKIKKYTNKFKHKIK